MMLQLLRHLDALACNAPAEVVQAVQALVQRVLERAARAGAHPADLGRWHEQARELGLSPVDQAATTAIPRS